MSFHLGFIQIMLNSLTVRLLFLYKSIMLIKKPILLYLIRSKFSLSKWDLSWIFSKLVKNFQPYLQGHINETDPNSSYLFTLHQSHDKNCLFLNIFLDHNYKIFGKDNLSYRLQGWIWIFLKSNFLGKISRPVLPERPYNITAKLRGINHIIID